MRRNGEIDRIFLASTASVVFGKHGILPDLAARFTNGAAVKTAALAATPARSLFLSRSPADPRPCEFHAGQVPCHADPNCNHGPISRRPHSSCRFWFAGALAVWHADRS